MVISSKHMSKLFKQCVIYIYVYIGRLILDHKERIYFKFCTKEELKIGHEVNPLYIIQLTWNEKNKLISKMVLFLT